MFIVLNHEKFWKRADHVEYEVRAEVWDCYVFQGLMAPLLFHEIQNNLDEVDDINDQLNRVENLVLPSDSLVDALSVFCLVHLREHLDEWVHNKLVDKDQSDEKVPGFDEGGINIEHVPG